MSSLLPDSKGRDPGLSVRRGLLGGGRSADMDLLALIFLLGICGSLTAGNDVNPAAPEDLDGSGDDEDFSGSGTDSFLVDADSTDGSVFSTPVSALVPTVTQVSLAQKPDVAVEKETEEENVTQVAETTKPYNSFDDLFGVDPVEKEPFAEEGTTLEPSTQQTSTVESEDVKKHHHHHPHHTTMPGTSLPAKIDVEETTTSLAEVEKPFVAAEEATTSSTPDEGDMADVVEQVTQSPEDAVQHVGHPGTTSGLTSTSYAEIEETTANAMDIDEIPAFVDSEETSVTDEAPTQKPHHHHTLSTAIPLGESDALSEATEKPVYLEPEDDQDHKEATTVPSSEDKHHDHKHHHHKHHHHHTTTPEATQATVTDQPIVNTQESKGRRFNAPPAKSTTEVSVIPEDEEPVGSTVQYNHSVNPIQDEDTPDSAEEESGNGPVVPDDIFFEAATVSVVNSDRMAPAPGDGSAGASHGIMERKELLAGIIAGGLAGLVFAASLVAFVFYRMKKKDEGSYSLEEPKQSNGGYQKPREQREFYA